MKPHLTTSVTLFRKYKRELIVDKNTTEIIQRCLRNRENRRPLKEKQPNDS